MMEDFMRDVTSLGINSDTFNQPVGHYQGSFQLSNEKLTISLKSTEFGTCLSTTITEQNMPSQLNGVTKTPRELFTIMKQLKKEQMKIMEQNVLVITLSMYGFSREYEIQLERFNLETKGQESYDVQTLKDEIDSLNRQIKQLELTSQIKMTLLKNQNSELEKKNKQLSWKNDDLEKEIAKIGIARSRQETADSSDKGSTEDKINEHSNTENANKILIMSREIERLNHMLVSRKMDFLEKENKLEMNVSTLEMKIKELEEENERLRNGGSESCSGFSTSDEKQSLMKQLEIMKNSLAEYNKYNQSLRTELKEHKKARCQLEHEKEQLERKVLTQKQEMEIVRLENRKLGQEIQIATHNKIGGNVQW